MRARRPSCLPRRGARPPPPGGRGRGARRARLGAGPEGRPGEMNSGKPTPAPTTMDFTCQRFAIMANVRKCRRPVSGAIACCRRGGPRARRRLGPSRRGRARAGTPRAARATAAARSWRRRRRCPSHGSPASPAEGPCPRLRRPLVTPPTEQFRSGAFLLRQQVQYKVFLCLCKHDFVFI